MKHGPSSDHANAVHGPRWLPIVLALLLGTAAVVSGITAWRVAVHLGHSQTAFSVSTKAFDDTNTLGQNSTDAANEERSLFIAWDQAQSGGDAKTTENIWGMMSIPAQRAITWWIEQPLANRPPSPFSAANPQWTTPRTAVEARNASAEASAVFADAGDQLVQSHNLELLEALLAIALLTGGLAALIRNTSSQFILLGVTVTAIFLAVGGLVVLW